MSKAWQDKYNGDNSKTYKGYVDKLPSNPAQSKPAQSKVKKGK